MKEIKTFKPSSIPFIMIMVLLNIALTGLLALIITGFLQLNFLYITVGILGFGSLMFQNIRLLTWKIEFLENYILVPSGKFGRFLYQKNEQKIEYKNIEKIELALLPLQILFIKCKGVDKPNAIYVKQFTKKQIEQVLDEINIRTKK